MFIVYIADHNDVALDQIEKISRFECTLRQNDISDASFEMRNDDDKCTLTNLKQFNRVKINYLNEVTGSEQLIMQGVIALTETSLETTKVKVKDFNFLFSKKTIKTPRTLNGALNTFLQACLDEINLRENTLFTLDCTVSTTVTIADQFAKGTTLFDILKKISSAGYDRAFVGRTIKVATLVGVDRTLNDANFLQYSYESSAPDSRSIRNVTITRNADNIANAVDDTQGTPEATDSTSITGFGRTEKTISSSPTSTVAQYLADRKDGLPEIDVTPISRDFFSVGVGDLVSVLLNVGQTMVDLTTSVKVIEKSINGGDLKKPEIKLAKGTVRTKDFYGVLKDLQDDQRIKDLS